MERHPFTVKERTSFKGLVRMLAFMVCYLAILFIIGRETGGLVTIVLMFVSFFALSALYLFITRRSTTSELRMSPCPKCGLGPMRFEPSSQGDYALICDKCQIEWTLDTPEGRTP